jgi:hypothetical protein
MLIICVPRNQVYTHRPGIIAPSEVLIEESQISSASEQQVGRLSTLMISTQQVVEKYDMHAIMSRRKL